MLHPYPFSKKKPGTTPGFVAQELPFTWTGIEASFMKDQP
jgi:hypothetical protein